MRAAANAALLTLALVLAGCAQPAHPQEARPAPAAVIRAKPHPRAPQVKNPDERVEMRARLALIQQQLRRIRDALTAEDLKETH